MYTWALSSMLKSKILHERKSNPPSLSILPSRGMLPLNVPHAITATTSFLPKAGVKPAIKPRVRCVHRSSKKDEGQLSFPACANYETATHRPTRVCAFSGYHDLSQPSRDSCDERVRERVARHTNNERRIEF